MFKIKLDRNFKWNRKPPVWSSVFSSSNDRYDVDRIAKELASYGRNSLELITVVGGCSVFKLLAKVPFARVTFVDKNINELFKIATIVKRIVDDKMPFQGFYWLDELLRHNPNLVYVPQYAKNYVELEFTQSDVKPKQGKQSWMRSITPVANFPHLQWKPTQQEQDQLRFNLARCNRDLIPGSLVALDAESRGVVSFLSHPPAKIETKIENASFEIPISATSWFKSTRKTKFGPSPHQWFNAIVDPLVVGSSLQVFVKDRHAKRQTLCDRGVTVANLNNASPADTVVTHLINSHSAESDLQKFQIDVRRCAKMATKRILVCEHNADVFPKLQTSRDTMEFSIPGFAFRRFVAVPGGGSPERNLIAIYDRN